MVYFAHSTMVLYGASIVTHRAMSPAEFVQANAAACQRVGGEAESLFGYELSHEQMFRAAYAYLAGVYQPKDVTTSALATLN